MRTQLFFPLWVPRLCQGEEIGFAVLSPTPVPHAVILLQVTRRLNQTNALRQFGKETSTLMLGMVGRGEPEVSGNN